MRLLPVALVAALALLAGAASASGGSRPTGQIVLGMDLYCKGQGGEPPTDCGKGEIALVDANGTGRRVLTHDRVTETSPVWSPNHEQIAYLRPRAHTSDQVWVMNADGTNQHAVSHFTSAPQLYGNPATPDLTWSPDGQELVFSAFANSNAGVQQLFALSVRTHAVRRLTRVHVGATNPQWSPDGRWIVFTYGDYVKEIRPDGRGIRHILYVTSKKGLNFEPNW